MQKQNEAKTFARIRATRGFYLFGLLRRIYDSPRNDESFQIQAIHKKTIALFYFAKTLTLKLSLLAL